MFSCRIILYNNGLNFDKSFPNELEVHNLYSYGAKYKFSLSHKQCLKAYYHSLPLLIVQTRTSGTSKQTGSG